MRKHAEIISSLKLRDLKFVLENFEDATDENFKLLFEIKSDTEKIVHQSMLMKNEHSHAIMLME